MSSCNNLSETLFKPSFKHPETSTLTKRVGAVDYTTDAHWYRSINRLEWYWRGIDPIELDCVLARIAASNAERTNQQWLDTVVGYCPGNWIYEFTLQAAEWQQRASEIDDAANKQTDTEQAKRIQQYWLNACNFYSLASYPHLKGDVLGEQAALFAQRAYREALIHADFGFNELTFKVNNHSLTGILHLPEQSGGPYPTVLICSGLDNLQSDYYHLFARYLKPAGIAMLCIDPPSIGSSVRWSLTQDTSQIHKQVLEQLPSIAWIDHTKVAVLGCKFGGNIAMRLAYLAPNRIKAVACLTPIVHQLFTDSKLQQMIPTMYRDMIANCLGLYNVSNQQLIAELSAYSLKNQGLLGRNCAVPALSVYMENDQLSNVNESKLIVNSSIEGKLLKVPSTPLKTGMDNALKQMVDWITKQLN